MNTNLSIWPTYYVPAPELPRWFRKALVRLEGRNPADETQGIWRVVWGMDAREFMNGDPNAIKYPNPNEATLGWACWMLEKWVEPKFFSEKDWNDARYGEDTAGTGKLIDYLGPYRRHGQYILWYPLISDLDALPISPQLLDFITERVKAGQETSLAEMYALREVHRRRKMAAAAEVTDKQLEEQREYFRMNKDRLNKLATTEYAGLDTARAVGSHLRVPTSSDLTQIATALPSVRKTLCPQQSENSTAG